jgi:ABC-2 type transport system permease protein
MFVSSLVWVVLMVVLSMAISAWVKWRIAASAGLFALFTAPPIMGQVFNATFKTCWGYVINLFATYGVITESMFGLPIRSGRWAGITLPTYAAWISIIMVIGLALLLMSRRIRAYEVTR